MDKAKNVLASAWTVYRVVLWCPDEDSPTSLREFTGVEDAMAYRADLIRQGYIYIYIFRVTAEWINPESEGLGAAQAETLGRATIEEG